LINVVVAVSAPRAAVLTKANQPIPNSAVTKLVVDTGASLTAIDITILKQLGLTPRGKAQIHTPSTQGQPHLVDQYDVGIVIYGATAQAVCHTIPTLPVLDGHFKAQGIDGLLGRDVLAMARMHYGGPDGWYGISF
jgi:hypothetical protein